MSTFDYDISPRSESEGKGNDTYFWPILILIIGSVVSTGYQIIVLQDQLNSVTQTVGQMTEKVKQAQYEKAKLYKLAADVLQVSATDPSAKQIVTEYKIQETAPSQISGTFPVSSTNSAAK
jgi:hypothetical protein